MNKLQLAAAQYLTLREATRQANDRALEMRMAASQALSEMEKALGLVDVGKPQLETPERVAEAILDAMREVADEARADAVARIIPAKEEA